MQLSTSLHLTLHNKILPGDIFGLILKNKMAATGVFSTLSEKFCWPSRAKGVIGRDLKFAGYIHHYKVLTGNIFGLILKTRFGLRPLLQGQTTIAKSKSAYK